jgi:hypothetical protein
MEKRLSGWTRELLRAHGLIADLFVRSEPRARSLAYLQGLLSGCERKNGWQLAEWMEEETPYRMQHLLDRARWNADLARDQLRDYVLEELSSPEAVLIVDETGFLKKAFTRRVSSASTPALPDASRTARWAYFSAMAATKARHWWTANSTFHKSGLQIASAAVKPGFLRLSSLLQNRS